jgi:hypothetical protein
MDAVVVYESLWGNTAAVAKAIAEGIGGERAAALSTAEATPDRVAGVKLIVAGAPLLGFQLPTPEMRANIARTETRAPEPADVSGPSVREWIGALEPSEARCCGFETRIWWSPGSAAKTISALLREKGLGSAGPDQKFLVTGRYGPLKDGELERARAWGATLGGLLG